MTKVPPKPVLHPKMKLMAEQFFDSVKATDPHVKINAMLDTSSQEFRDNAHLAIRLVVMLSICNIVYHALTCFFAADYMGLRVWILFGPTACYYFIVAGVVMLAINWVREIDENVKLQSVNVVRVWEGLKAAEGTFWEQSESIAEHIQALENIVSRLEHPAHRAVDEALEITFEKGQAIANRLKSISSRADKSEVVGKLEKRVNACLGTAQGEPGSVESEQHATATSELKATFNELRELLREATTTDPQQGGAPGEAPLTGAGVTGERSWSTLPPASSSRVPPLPPGWRSARDAEGRRYYFHRETKKTQWNRPVVPGQSQWAGARATLVTPPSARPCGARPSSIQTRGGGDESSDSGEQSPASSAPRTTFADVDERGGSSSTKAPARPRMTRHQSVEIEDTGALPAWDHV